MQIIPDELRHVLVADPETLSGAVRFKDTRVPVQALIDTLDAGQGLEQFLTGWPNVPREHATAVIRWEQNQARQTFGLESNDLMRILLDNNVHVRFAGLITGHDVAHVQDIGWETLRNGDLIAAAEQAGYDAIVTTDKRMQYQQNLKGRRMGIIVLNSRRIIFEDIAGLAPQVMVALEKLAQGAFVIVQQE